MGQGSTVRRCDHSPQLGVRRQAAPAAVTVVGVSCQAELDRGEGAPRLCSPLEIPGFGTAPNISDVSRGEGRRGVRSKTTLGPAVRWVRRRCPDDRTRPGEEGGSGSPSARALRPAVVAEACTWAHPMELWAQKAEDRGSAQILVQVGRREEGVGSQAHSQEAPDQGGAKTTSPGGGLI